jgi:serine/threonine protein kinase/formylglycine-generating enzyme required for sulfatase activity
VTAPSLLGEPTLDARYLLERRLGQGGMGVVFQARHIFLKTSHAIKVILPDLVGNDPMLTTRFRQEALAAAAIRHPNIIAVTDFGVVRGTMPFLVMEFVRGRSLQDILATEGAMPPQRAWEFISAIAAGVGAAHRQNIVHRDLKPLNIMVQDDVPVAEGVKVLDFGLAKIKSGELLGSFVQAQTSGLMGSPFYMAPEQWSDDEPDARADIYSLGVILYQMLAGEVPFKGSSIPSIMKKHLTLSPPSFQSMGISVPPAIEAVVRHSLEKEIDARIDSVPSFLRELHAALNSSPVVAAASRETVAMDPNRTMASATQPPITPAPDLSATAAQPPIAPETNFGASFDSMAGTVSGAQLDKVLEEDRQRKERQERDRREQEQHDKLERMALQAQELEDRLERLSGSMPPSTADDPETTHVQVNVANAERAANRNPALPVGPGRQMVVDFAPQRKGPPPLLLIGAAVMVLVLAGVGISAYLMLRSGPGIDDPQPTPTPVVPPKTKADLLAIDGGSFLMGRKNGPPQETPAHPVTVPQFMMDRTEVSNTEYADFVRETNHVAPGHWAGTKAPFGQELWPVVNVSFEDANAFAAWRSKRDGISYRLPTEEEWEYAARNGEQSDLYPWGPDWQNNVAVLKEATPASVGSRPGGKNKWGVVDLIGNVWEWTSSKVSVYPGNRVVVPSSTQDWITIRGGCYVSDPGKADAPVSACMREFVPPSTKTTLLGFRLVRSGS